MRHLKYALPNNGMGCSKEQGNTVWKKLEMGKKKYRQLDRWIETNTHTFEYTQTVSGRKTGDSDPSLQRDHLVTMYIPTIFTF